MHTLYWLCVASSPGLERGSLVIKSENFSYPAETWVFLWTCVTYDDYEEALLMFKKQGQTEEVLFLKL